MNADSKPDAYRILVVDDNLSIHEDFRKILCPGKHASEVRFEAIAEDLLGYSVEKSSGSNFEMDSAFQGQEALAMVEAAARDGRPYMMAFVDVRMPPGWDGIETIQHIWMKHPQIQVVICSAYSDYSWDEILDKLGRTDSLVILKKPFDNMEVLQLAHTLTEKWLVTRQAEAQVANLHVMVQERTQELLDANRQLESEIRRRAMVEFSLRESEERFHKAFETVSVPVAILERETGNYIELNRSFAELCGYSKAEILGQTTDALQLFVDLARTAGSPCSLLNGCGVRNAEVAIRRKAGEIRETLLSVEPLKLGEQLYILVALQDVTEQKKLEDQLRQAQKMEAVGLLAAGVAHDFNNLLTVIHGYASLQLANSALEADIAKAFGQVKAASERAAGLTRQLLTVSRRQIVERRPLDLGEAVIRMKDLLSRTLGETIQLEYEPGANLPCVNADPSNLDQVIMNLAVNARDAMPNGGRLLLSTGSTKITAAQAAGHPDRQEGSFVKLTVRDTGCGMDRDTLGRIFEPFFTTKPIGRGTGLGLSTVYGILKQHDGWIEVSSQPGCGTTFEAYLPALETTALTAEPPAAVGDRKRTPADRSKRNTAVLVVEDEPGVRDFVTLTLTRQGYEVLQATSGSEALNQWNTSGHKIQLLLTDMVMPGGISGTTLAKHLLRHAPGLRVIFTSGYHPGSSGHGDTLTEGVNFLSKPFTHDDLLAAVNRALGSPAPERIDPKPPAGH